METLQQAAPFPGGIAIDDFWKMVNGKELYYLKDDPGELYSLHEKYPLKLDSLTQLYLEWWNAIQKERSPERRPIPISQHASPLLLKPHHGKATGKLKFMGHRGLLGERVGSHPSGVDGDWLSGWRDSNDRITWRINCESKGMHELGIQLRSQSCKSGKIHLEMANQSMSYKLEPNNYKDFTFVKLGTIELKKGLNNLQIYISELNEDCRLDVKEVALHWQKETN